MSDDTTKGGSVPTEPRAAQPDDTQALATEPAAAEKGGGQRARSGGDAGRHANAGNGGANRGSTTARSADGTQEGSRAAPTTVLPGGGAGRPARPSPPRTEARPPGGGRAPTRAGGRRRARLVLQRVDPWSVFLFSLVASICLGVVLLAAVAALYFALSSVGVLDSLNGVLGEVAGTGSPDEVVEPFITSSRVLSATAVLAAVDVVLLTALATLGALLYNLCASLTGGIEVQLGERE